MKPRTVLFGCAAVALLALLSVGIGGYLTFRHYTAAVPLPPLETFAAPDSVGVAQVRLEEGNAWVRGAFEHIARHSQSPPPINRITPLELLWTARGADASRGHLLTLSLAPAGRFFGMMMDLGLWKAGRGGGPLVRRVEHGGEGLTSFPAARIPGWFFVRGGTLAWGSDEEVAGQAVDRIVSRETGAPADPPGGGSLTALLPSEPHAVRGALLERDGSLARLLGLLPAAAPAPALTGVSSLAFTFDPDQTTGAAGEIRLSFDPAAPEGNREQTAAVLAAWLQGVRFGGVTLEAAPAGSIVRVKAAGLDQLFDAAVRAAMRARRSMDGGSPAAEDQSSSTFQ
jgi:hypothetical protein